MLGSPGFIILLGRFLWSRSLGAAPQLLDHLSQLNMAALLLAITGGLGFLFSLALTSWIRCYYRICIYIAFFSIFAVLLCWTRLDGHLPPWKKAKIVFGGLLMLILGIGIL